MPPRKTHTEKLNAKPKTHRQCLRCNQVTEYPHKPQNKSQWVKPPIATRCVYHWHLCQTKHREARGHLMALLSNRIYWGMRTARLRTGALTRSRAAPSSNRSRKGLELEGPEWRGWSCTLLTLNESFQDSTAGSRVNTEQAETTEIKKQGGPDKSRGGEQKQEMSERKLHIFFLTLCETTQEGHH